MGRWDRGVGLNEDRFGGRKRDIWRGKMTSEGGGNRERHKGTRCGCGRE